MAKAAALTKSENNTCFIIMPISDPDGYTPGHFRRVYEDIFKPACEEAGYEPKRGDDVKQTNLIHLDVLQKLIDSPMALCDLSSRNPNVLFELGIRQAFDKPTILVQEIGTPKIFDISPFRFSEYRRDLKYREVLEDQLAIADSLKATKAASANGEGVNSIISLLSLTHPAKLKEIKEANNAQLFRILSEQLNDLKSELRMTRVVSPSIGVTQSDFHEVDKLLNNWEDALKWVKKKSDPNKIEEYRVKWAIITDQLHAQTLPVGARNRISLISAGFNKLSKENDEITFK